MQDILPANTYLDEHATFPWRTVAVMAILWGTPMTALLVSSNRGSGDVLFSLCLGVSAAVLFGVGWTVFFRRSTRSLTVRLLAADPALTPSPPAGAYDLRHLCSLMLNPRFAVGGHLYVSKHALTFVPHRKNLARHQAPTVLTGWTADQITVHRHAQHGLARLLSGGRVSMLTFGAPTQMTLLTPGPEMVAARLKEYAGARSA